ncbi:MAG: GNAT family N-acetyltransferase, partial [Lachnospiraceae bacterium]|nr:GNAT family N-acetyltransferase [Lachnospiraceae bacterium]
RFRELEKIVAKEGVVLGSAHPFYLPDPGFTPLTPAPDLEIRWFEGDAIEAFRGDKRYTNAYSFDEAAPDMIGVGAYVDGRCIGMAGASADSPTLWQIGIDVDKASRGRHVGATLVSLLKEEIIKKGHTPFYGTSMSNIASQRVAHHSGFVVAWAELSSDRAG